MRVFPVAGGLLTVAQVVIVGLKRLPALASLAADGSKRHPAALTLESNATTVP